MVVAVWPSIGLEFHIQLKRKLFSRGSPIALFDIATPGTLPILNRQCVLDGILAGLAFNCKISTTFQFDRKHYFYHDLPHGYQITQKFHPIAKDGFIQLGPSHSQSHFDSPSPVIRIEQIQLEQDTARTLTPESITTYKSDNLDYSRAGMALLEIVTGPDISNSKEAADTVRHVQDIVRALEISDAQMSESSLRVDVNVSVRTREEGQLGTRCELKNLASIKQIQKAIDAEVERQKGILELGGKVVPTTRSFDEEIGETVELRLKESSYDYRYFPDPDIKDYSVSLDLITALSQTMPELPSAKKNRFIRDYKLTIAQAQQLVETSYADRFFESTLKCTYLDPKEGTTYPLSPRDPSTTANLILNTLFGELSSIDTTLKEAVEENIISPMQISSLIDALDSNQIVLHQVKPLITSWLSTKSKRSFIDEKNAKSSCIGFVHLEDLKISLRNIIKQNPNALSDLKKTSKPQIFTFFAGRLMKMVNGKTDKDTLQCVIRDVFINEFDIQPRVFSQWIDETTPRGGSSSGIGKEKAKKKKN